jgi:hypothetical protein
VPRREQLLLQAAQKDLRGKAREKSTSEGVLKQYVGAGQLSATKSMSLFQESAKRLSARAERAINQLNSLYQKSK